MIGFTPYMSMGEPRPFCRRRSYVNQQPHQRRHGVKLHMNTTPELLRS